MHICICDIGNPLFTTHDLARYMLRHVAHDSSFLGAQAYAYACCVAGTLPLQNVSTRLARTGTWFLQRRAHHIAFEKRVVLHQ